MIVDMSQANCIGTDPDVFFPETLIEATVKVPMAKKICQGCPVALQCFTEAMEKKHYGIWGGTTDDERIAMRRNKRTLTLHMDKLKRQQ